MAEIYGDRWEIVKSLGEGGQAHTFLVTDAKGVGETYYVLKRLKNINRLSRFKREIEAIRNLSHENIVQLKDFDLEAEKPYLVTEYCSGESLDKARSFWHNDPIKAIELFQQICEGIKHAHSNGIIHRDLKPANIFLRTKAGPAVVGDFGLCYIDDDGLRITLTDDAIGPRLFIAPELEDGRAKEISAKSDVYSLGKILYWLLSEGSVFSREKHRERGWDLKDRSPVDRNLGGFLGWKNIYMEHVNRLLDLMIVHNPRERESVYSIISFIPRLIRLVQKEFNPIDKDIKQPCTYCGYGYYLLCVSDNDALRKFGFTPVGAADWRVYSCSFCGHVQTFRVDIAGEEQKNRWKSIKLPNI